MDDEDDDQKDKDGISKNKSEVPSGFLLEESDEDDDIEPEEDAALSDFDESDDEVDFD